MQKKKQNKYQKEYNQLVPSILGNLKYLRDYTDCKVYKDHIECLTSPMRRAVEILEKKKKLTSNEDDIRAIWSNMIDKIHSMEQQPTTRKRKHFRALVEIILQQKEENYIL